VADLKASNDRFKDGLISLAVEYLSLTTAELDPYARKKGQIEVSGLEVSLFTPDHIQFARYGRRPGKQPPPDIMLKWVRERNIQFPGLSKEGTAYAISASIAKKGTLDWVKDAPNALESAIRKNFELYNDKLNKSLMVLLNFQTSSIYKNMPIEKNFKP